ncbi:MAG: hypothetical protein AAF290_07700 [Pseudomonadota bacterium]
MRHYLNIAALLLLALPAIALGDDSRAEASAPPVIVNGETLSKQDVMQLRQLYGTVVPGDYWYDSLSGLYGKRNGPPEGQLHAGLRVGGALSPKASGGGHGRMTGVFINGREIHPLEYRFYQSLFGQVLPGRFWMNAQGVGGYVGGPPIFNVVQAMQQARQRGGNTGSVYMPWIGGKPRTSVGRASDGCVYIVQGDYSAESC